MNKVQNDVSIYCGQLHLELKKLGFDKSSYESSTTRLMNWAKELCPLVGTELTRTQCSKMQKIRRNFQSEVSHLKRVLRKNKKMYTPEVKEHIERLEEIHKSFQSFLDATSHSYRREDEDLWHEVSGLSHWTD